MFSLGATLLLPYKDDNNGVDYHDDDDDDATDLVLHDVHTHPALPAWPVHRL